MKNTVAIVFFRRWYLLLIGSSSLHADRSYDLIHLELEKMRTLVEKKNLKRRGKHGDHEEPQNYATSVIYRWKNKLYGPTTTARKVEWSVDVAKCLNRDHQNPFLVQCKQNYLKITRNRNEIK